MSTPSKINFQTSQMSPNGSDIMTPFKGRAVNENRRRQALRMSVTPGLKRRLQIQRSHSSWRSNPVELRSFINDMSESRYQNGKNLMGQLSLAANDTTDEVVPPPSSIANGTVTELEPSFSVVDQSVPSISENQQRVESDKVANDANQDRNESPSRPPKRLSDLIFSQLKTVPREVKIRKLEPLEISDVKLKPLIDHNNQNNNSLNVPPPPLIPNSSVDIVANLGAGLPHTPPTLQPIYTEDTQQFTSLNPDDNNMQMGLDIHSPEMEPSQDYRNFSMDQLSQSLDTQEGMEDDYGNVNIVTKIRHLLIKKDGTFEKDLDKIITFLNNHNLILTDSMPSINDIYEICCQYLDMAEINDMERVWFD
ncbi:inner kinetochore subunit Cnn1p [Monosporozyma servazzii]